MSRMPPRPTDDFVSSPVKAIALLSRGYRPPTPPVTSPVRPVQKLTKGVSHANESSTSGPSTEDKPSSPSPLVHQPKPNCTPALPNIYSHPFRRGIWPIIKDPNDFYIRDPSSQVDFAYFSGGQTFEYLRKHGLALKDGSAISRSECVAGTVARVASDNYQKVPGVAIKGKLCATGKKASD